VLKDEHDEVGRGGGSGGSKTGWLGEGNKDLDGRSENTEQSPEGSPGGAGASYSVRVDSVKREELRCVDRAQAQNRGEPWG